jgi:hypothetical protein
MEIETWFALVCRWKHTQNRTKTKSLIDTYEKPGNGLFLYGNMTIK